MTKTEQKKLEKQQKDDFIRDAVATVMDAIRNSYMDARFKCVVRMNTARNSWYFTFHRYVQEMKIFIYSSGDIDFHFKEFCHDDVDIRVVHYESVPEDPEAALKQLKDDVELAVSSYLNFDWHAFMDYQSWERGADWREKARLFQEECAGL